MTGPLPKTSSTVSVLPEKLIAYPPKGFLFPLDFDFVLDLDFDLDLDLDLDFDFVLDLDLDFVELLFVDLFFDFLFAAKFFYGQM